MDLGKVFKCLVFRFMMVFMCLVLSVFATIPIYEAITGVMLYFMVSSSPSKDGGGLNCVLVCAFPVHGSVAVSGDVIGAVRHFSCWCPLFISSSTTSMSTAHDYNNVSSGVCSVVLCRFGWRPCLA